MIISLISLAKVKGSHETYNILFGSFSNKNSLVNSSKPLLGGSITTTSIFLYFSFNNSNAIVVAVGCYVKVSKDTLEKIPEISLCLDNDEKINIVEKNLSNKEYENIIKSKNPSDEFFKYWVLKESYMKYTGLGFNLPLDSFEIIIEEDMRLKNDKNDIKFNLFDIENYKLAVASHEKVDKCIEYKIELLY